MMWHFCFPVFSVFFFFCLFFASVRCGFILFLLPFRCDTSYVFFRFFFGEIPEELMHVPVHRTIAIFCVSLSKLTSHSNLRWKYLCFHSVKRFVIYPTDFFIHITCLFLCSSISLFTRPTVNGLCIHLSFDLSFILTNSCAIHCA